MLSNIRIVCTSLELLVLCTHSCYAQPSVLFFDDARILSVVGPQQGDPLGGLFFCLAFSVLHRRAGLLPPLPAPALSSEPPVVPLPSSPLPAGVDIAAFFYDDGAIGGDADGVARVFDALCQFGPDYGIHFGSKCLLARPSPRCAVVPADVPGFAGPQPARLYLPPLKAPPPGEGVVLLKAPIGDADFRERYVQSRVDRVAPLLAALRQLPDAHCAFHLLRSCCSVGKMMWVMRTAALPAASTALRAFDRDVRLVFEQIVGAVASDATWTEARLGPRHGGVGLRAAADHAPCAYVASRAACYALCRRIHRRFGWEAETDPSGPLAAALRSIAARVPPQFDFVVDVAGDVPPPSQQALSAAVDAAVWQALHSEADDAARARLRAKTAAHAGAWLAALPSPALALWFQPLEFRIALRLWLGLPVADGADTCPACARKVDDLGTHALACTHAGTITLRHNALRDAVWFLCRAAGLRPEVEKSGLLPSTLYRPGDVYLPQYPGGGPARIALDLAVVSPLQRRFLADAGVISRAAAAAYSDTKAERHDCAAACRAHGIRFVPLVTDAFGGWAPEAAAVIGDIARAQAARSGADPALTLAHAHEALSATLWRGNVNAVLARLQQPAAHDASTGAVYAAWRQADACAAAGVGTCDGDAASCDGVPDGSAAAVAAPHAQPPPPAAAGQPLAAAPPRPQHSAAAGAADAAAYGGMPAPPPRRCARRRRSPPRRCL